MRHGVRKIYLSIGAVAAVAVAVLISSSAFAQKPASPAREKIGEVLGRPVFRDELRSENPSDLEDTLHRLFSAPVLEKYCDAHRAELEPTPAELAAVEVALEKDVKEEHVRRAAEIRESLRLVDKELAKKDSEFHREYLLKKKGEMQGMLKQEFAAKTEDPPDPPPFVLDDLKEINARLAKPEVSILERIVLLAMKSMCQRDLAHPYRMFAAFAFTNWKMQRHFYDRFGGGRVLWQQAGLEAFDAYRRWLESEERKGNFKITDPKLRQAFYRYWKLSHDPFMITDPEEIRRGFLKPEWAPPASKVSPQAR
jgi:hypothetical protein